MTRYICDKCKAETELKTEHDGNIVVGRKLQIKYLKERLKDTRNSRIREGIKKEIIKLRMEKPWN